MGSNRMEYKEKLTDDFGRTGIISYGGLSDGITSKEFFEGISYPWNKELVRIFKDVELVEQLGSGLPGIMQFYNKESFTFSDNFLRMAFSASEEIGVGKMNEILKQNEGNPHVTLEELATTLNLSVRGVEYNLKKLREHAVIERKGRRKDGYWEFISSDENEDQ